MPFGSIVPKGTPVGGTKPVPGTGPYKVAAFTPHRYARLVRNPVFHVWSRAAQPAGLPDTIEYSTTLAQGKGSPAGTRSAFLAAAAGRIDVPEGGVPAELLPKARAQYPAQLHATPSPQTYWVLLNTHRAPFNNVHARRALAFALDRGRMVANVGGPDQATPTCQLLPPGLPGYKQYCPFTAGDTSRWTAPDLARARAEVARSGTRGAHVRVITTDQTPGFGRQNLEVAATLRRLGYRVAVKHYAVNDAILRRVLRTTRVTSTPRSTAGSRTIPRRRTSSGAQLPQLALHVQQGIPPAARARDRRGGGERIERPWTQFDRYATNDAGAVPYPQPEGERLRVEAGRELPAPSRRSAC